MGPTKNINNLNEHEINDFFFGVEIRMKMLEMFSTLFYVHVDGVCCYIIIFFTYIFWKFKYLMFDENIFICLKALSFRIFFSFNFMFVWEKKGFEIFMTLNICVFIYIKSMLRKYSGGVEDLKILKIPMGGSAFHLLKAVVDNLRILDL